MALELRIAGPGFLRLCRIRIGASEVIIGRDAACGVCLPDAQRNVSRRHLSVWNEGEELHFRVLSAVNGICLPTGIALPGATGTLEPGQVLELAAYRLTVRLRSGPAEDQIDMRGLVDSDGESDTAVMPVAAPAPMGDGHTVVPGAGPATALAGAEDDPFGDWGFESTFGPGPEAGGPLDASKLDTASDLCAFFHGLGLAPEHVGPLSVGELEAMGALVRATVLGLLEMHTAALGVRQSLHTEDHTMVAGKDNNPLKTGWPDETKLRYLFGRRAATAGFASPLRAVNGLVADLVAHDRAIGTATRVALAAAVSEFAPPVLRARLLGTGPKLFEGARMWDAYSAYYAAQATLSPGWTQRLLDKYFTESYIAEKLRIKRETLKQQ